MIRRVKPTGKTDMSTRRLSMACIAAWICLAAACAGSDDDDEVLTYEVAAYRSPALGFFSFPIMCINVRASLVR
jgi:hypothetical protein